MPKFWGRERDSEIPEELREMDPKDIVAAVKKSKELEGALQTANTELAAQKSAFETFSGEFETKVSAAVAAEVAKLRPATQQHNNTPPALTDWLVDPDKALDERLQRQVAPIAGIAIQSAVYQAKNAAREKMQRAQRAAPGKNYDGFFFEKFEAELDNLSKTIPSVQLTNPETWEHLYYNVKGRHSDEIAAQFRDGKGEYVIESGSAGGGHAPQAGDEDKLTPLELKIAQKTGRTPEQYLEQKKKINSNGMGVNI
jgi:hypothetical protein